MLAVQACEYTPRLDQKTLKTTGLPQLPNQQIFFTLPQIVTSNAGRGGRRYAPYAFTEHGIVMLSSVLRSERAIAANIQTVRTFVKLREVMISHKDLARKIASMESKYDHNFQVVFDALRQLMNPAQPKKGQIGYIHHDDDKGPKGRKR